MLYKPLLHCNNHLNGCSEVTRQRASVKKVGVVDVDVYAYGATLKKSWLTIGL